MKTLILDIETAPNLAYVWGLWDQNIGLPMLVEPTEVICFAAKWHGSKQVMFHREELVAKAWNLLDEADVVVHFNGKRFDIPHLNREFVTAGFGPPSPFKQVDLLNVVKKRFKFPSNKLQYVSTQLGLKGKANTGGFDLWLKCMSGDLAAWKKMERYNKQDVVLTEQVYDILQPWVPGLPSIHLYDMVMDGCPRCGSTDTQKRGFAYTTVSKFQQYQCNECGGYFRDSKRIEGVHVQEVVL